MKKYFMMLIYLTLVSQPNIALAKAAPASLGCHTLTCVRKEIDHVDDEIVDLLVQRFAYVKKAGELKRNRKHIHDCAREQEILAQVRKQAEQQGLPGVIMVEIFKTILDQSNLYERKYHPFHN